MKHQNSIINTIILTEKQFFALLKTVYLGNWMANAYSIENLKKIMKI